MRTSIVFVLLIAVSSTPAHEKAYRQLLDSKKIGPTAESIGAFLIRHRQESAQTTKWVRQLGDTDFTVRENAMTSLLEAAGVPRDALREALKSDDAEVKFRARKILSETEDKPDVSPFPDVETSEALVWLIAEKKIVGCEDVLLALLEHHRKFDMIRRTAAAFPHTLDDDSTKPLLARTDRLTPTQKAALLAVVWANSTNKGKALAKSLTGAGSSEAVRLHAALEMVNHEDRTGLAVLVDLLDPKTSGLIRGYAHQALTKATGRAKADPDPANWKEWLAKNGDAKLRVPVELDLATFESFVRRVSLYSTGFTKGNSCEIWLDGKCLIGDDGKVHDRRGINIVAEHAGEIVLLGSYDLWGNRQSAANFVKDIGELPLGCHIAIAVSDEVSQYWNAETQRALESLGAKTSLMGKYRHAYYCIGSKGMPKGKAIEAIDPEEGPLYYPKSFANKVEIHENGPDEYRKEQRIRYKRGKRLIVDSPPLP